MYVTLFNSINASMTDQINLIQLNLFHQSINQVKSRRLIQMHEQLTKIVTIVNVVNLVDYLNASN
jgi:hypothetical protein